MTSSPHVLDDTSLRPCIVQHFHDFHTLPADGARLLMTFGHAYGKHWSMRACMKAQDRKPDLAWHRVFRQALGEQLDKVVKSTSWSLLSGESGTGRSWSRGRSIATPPGLRVHSWR